MELLLPGAVGGGAGIPGDYEYFKDRMSLQNNQHESDSQAESDWRQELKQRFEAHRQRKEGEDSGRHAVESSQPDGAQGEPGAGSWRKDARGEEASETAAGTPSIPPRIEPDEAIPQDVASSSEFAEGSPDPEPEATPEPLQKAGTLQESGPDTIERPLLSEDSPKSSRQQIITFSERATASSPPVEQTFRAPTSHSQQPEPESPPQQEEAPYEEDFQEEEAAPDAGWVSREIFLSRFLSGLVDLVLAAFAGLLFSWVASSILRFDFFSSASLEISAATALISFLVSSLFFLTLSGQTPGMHLTGLQLLYQDSDELPFMAVLIRVLLILPVIALVAGLLWGLFDPWGRCLHDRLSQTRVVSLSD